MHWMSFLSARNKVIKCHQHPYLGHHLVIQHKDVLSKKTIFFPRGILFLITHTFHSLAR